jgi:hypothetical protein
MPRMIASVFIIIGSAAGALAGCSVGTYGETMQGTDGNMGGGDDRNLCADRVATPGTAYNHVSAPTGTRAGMGCIAAACHLAGNTGAGAPAFGFAGTVYKDTNGTIPNPGVKVRLFPSTGNTKKSIAFSVSDSAGNFYISDTTLTAYPYNTDVTACNADSVAMGIRPMVGSILKAEANCNAGNTCHQAAPAKTATPIYLLD